MRTLALQIEYDGTNFSGWQIQPNIRTVQQEIETALEKLCGFPFSIQGSGRTDKGVHSRGQVAHTTIDDRFKIPADKIAFVISSILPKDIRIRKAKIFNTKFHARFNAIAREYSYTVAQQKSVFNRFFISYYHGYQRDI